MPNHEDRGSERATSGGDWSLQTLFHFTITCRSIDRSIEFYTTIGFELLRDNRDIVWPDYLAPQFGLEKAQGKGALLALGSGPEHTRIDLLEWIEPQADFPTGPREKRVPRIIALRTRNVRAAYEDLRGRGIEFLTPPRGPDEPTGVEAVVCCLDPDDTIVEFIEYMPGVLGSRIDQLERR